jgi:hypothetical protein
VVQVNNENVVPSAVALELVVVSETAAFTIVVVIVSTVQISPTALVDPAGQ